MSRRDRILYGAISGAIAGFVVGLMYGLIPVSELFSDEAFFLGLGGMALLGIAGAIKGSRKKDVPSLSSWMITGFISAIIVSIPIWPILFMGWAFSYAYSNKDARFMILSILPVTYAMGAFGGLIAGIVFQKIESWFES